MNPPIPLFPLEPDPEPKIQEQGQYYERILKRTVGPKGFIKVSEQYRLCECVVIVKVPIEKKVTTQTT